MGYFPTTNLPPPLLWSTLDGTRRAIAKAAALLEGLQLRLERRHRITATRAISSQRHTSRENRMWWNAYDWARGGEEWTDAVRDLRGLDPEVWKETIVRELMKRYLPASGALLEIGPGAGRWTADLVGHGGRIVLADITERCLELCRERFGARVETHLVTDGSLRFLADGSIHGVWSYDVFVHVNPHDTEVYVRELRRVLAPGAFAILHHGGHYADAAFARRALRSHVDAEWLAWLAAEHDFELVRQDHELPHFPGDVVSVLRRPLAAGETQREIAARPAA